jgi:hypothetical protein
MVMPSEPLRGCCRSVSVAGDVGRLLSLPLPPSRCLTIGDHQIKRAIDSRVCCRLGREQETRALCDNGTTPGYQRAHGRLPATATATQLTTDYPHHLAPALFVICTTSSRRPHQLALHSVPCRPEHLCTPSPLLLRRGPASVQDPSASRCHSPRRRSFPSHAHSPAAPAYINTTQLTTTCRAQIALAPKSRDACCICMHCRTIVKLACSSISGYLEFW